MDDSLVYFDTLTLKGMEADLGGTEVYAPLDMIIQQPLIGDYLRQIFLLTDGGVKSNSILSCTHLLTNYFLISLKRCRHQIECLP